MLDLIEIRNVGTTPMRLKHSQYGKVMIDPGARRILPISFATLHFGNPAAKNEGRNKLRDTEFKMARTKWGFYAGMMSEAEWLSTYCPRFECYDVETGERVYMVLDDPDGSLARTGGTGVDQSEAIERAGLEAQIAQLQAQQARILNLLTVQGVDPSALGLGLPDAPVNPLMPDGEPQEPPDVDLGDPADPDADPDVDADVDTDGTAQATRNEQRDDIPQPPEDEPEVTADKPRTTRVGPRGGTARAGSRSK